MYPITSRKPDEGVLLAHGGPYANPKLASAYVLKGELRES